MDNSAEKSYRMTVDPGEGGRCLSHIDKGMACCVRKEERRSRWSLYPLIAAIALCAGFFVLAAGCVNDGASGTSGYVSFPGNNGAAGTGGGTSEAGGAAAVTETGDGGTGNLNGEGAAAVNGVADNTSTAGNTGTSGSDDGNNGNNGDNDDGDNMNYRLYVHYINVGDGECILVKASSGRIMLIDTGSDYTEQTVLDYLGKQNIKKIDYVILTHPHPDMIGGIDRILREYEVDGVYAPAVGNEDVTFDDLIAALREKGKKLKFIKTGFQFDMGDGIEAMALSPISKSYVNLNNYTVMIRLSCGYASFLFAGDAEYFLQRQVLDKGLAVEADVLKVSGNAGINSLAPEFLQAVSPRYAVISIGHAETGLYPYPAVMKALDDKDVEIFMTNACGDIVAKTDGEVIKFNCKPVNAPAEPALSGTAQVNAAQVK